MCANDHKNHPIYQNRIVAPEEKDMLLRVIKYRQRNVRNRFHVHLIIIKILEFISKKANAQVDKEVYKYYHLNQQIKSTLKDQAKITSRTMFK